MAYEKTFTPKKVRSISHRLLRNVFTYYFLITLFITSVQIISEYRSTKENIQDELATIQESFIDTVAEAFWNIDIEQLGAIKICCGMV